ncbi:hypothetical protein [Estrella lausannensis]|uniref:Putative membrane protein n=1 Tax=Estrella lausannensis TaxID=483423 RepID=A0A0H5DQ07_9BACT|nr:hypothetical protein [Estrella lausannensis]CRX38118.1 putative membrane protein [Estrella lausannensis]
MRPSLIDYPGTILSIAVFIACFILIWSESRMPINSMIAAMMAGALTLLCYVVTKMVYLAMKRPKS